MANTTVKTVELQPSTAYAFKAAADARRRATEALNSLPITAIAQMAETQRQQVAAFAPILSTINTQVFEDMRRTIQLHNEAFRSISLPYIQGTTTMLAWQSALAQSITVFAKQSAINNLNILINFELPSIYIPSRLEELDIVEHDQADKPMQSKVLDVSIDQFGNYILGDQKIYRANFNNSEHGKMLNLLENRKDTMITKDELKAPFKAGNTRDIMKNLKKDLRELGYRLDYEAHRHQGLVYHGVLRRQ